MPVRDALEERTPPVAPPAMDPASVPLLALLPDDVAALVAASFTPVSFAFGEVIVRQGEAADSMYVITHGRARVLTVDEDGEELPLATVTAGDVVGEMAAVEGGVRSATVRASEAVRAQRLDAGLLRGLAATNPAVRTTLELDLKRNRLGVLFRRFPSFGQLPATLLHELLDAVEVLPVEAGEVIVREGDEPGGLYVVETGRLRAHREGRNLDFYRAGDLFGERSLFTGTPRAATVEALEAGRLLRLGVDTFRLLLDRDEAFRHGITQRVEQYDYRRLARVPVDFDQELLPADAHTPSTAQTEEPSPTDGGIGGPFATADGRFVKGDGRIKRFRHSYQVDERDCGAACLVMVARHFGRTITLSTARQACDTGAEGSTLAGIVRGAESLGLAARSAKASKSNLDHLPLPAAVHWQANHWIVLYDVTPRAVRAADPAVGLRTLDREEFLGGWSGYAALFEPTPAFDRPDEVRSRLAWLRPFLRQAARPIALGLLLALVMSGLQMVVPLLTQVVVDRVMGAGERDLLTVVLLALVGVVVTFAVASVAQGFVLARGAAAIDRATLDAVSRRLLSLPMRYFYARRTGDIQRRLDGMQALRAFFVSSVVRGVTYVFRLVASLVLMLTLSVTLTAVFCILLPLYVLVMRYASRRMRPLIDGLEEVYSRFSSRQIDAVKGIEAVKANAAEETMCRRLVGEFAGLADRRQRLDRATRLYEASVATIQSLSLATFLLVGAVLVLDGGLTLGAFVAFNSLVALATGPIMYLTDLWDDLQRAATTLTRVEDVFLEPPEDDQEPGRCRPVASLSGDVRLEGVGFRYGGEGSPWILEDVTLDVPAGTTVAIVGRSGSGKSTLAKLLAGLLLPTRGRIRYDGQDLADLDLRDLRRNIGTVLQDSYLFADTIAANIAVGDLEPDFRRVEWAARVANAHAFIARLPLGYETAVGETGVLLSGGQRQRVAIARAVYRQPPILLLDEATSALDTESERAVQENMDRLLEGRTSFVIAHRLSTVRNADLVVVLDEGRIVERGTHDELMARKGLYFYLTGQQLDL